MENKMRVHYVFALVMAVAQAGQVLRSAPQAAQQTGYRASPSISSPTKATVASYSNPIGESHALGGNFVEDLFSGAGFGQKSARAPAYHSSFHGGGFGGGYGGGGNDVFGGNNFGNQGSGGFGIGGHFQKGTAQVSLLDHHADRSDRNQDKYARDYANQDQGVSREDNQERRGQLGEAEFEKQQKKDATKGQKQQESFKQQAGAWNVDSKRQNDKLSHVGTLNRHDGELLRSDVSGDEGSKGLGVRKTAFINGNLGFENVGYNFDKDFDQRANERGGYKEVIGRDDNHVQIYQEKQRDHRLKDSNSEKFKKADDINRAAKKNEWLQNALQKQDQDQNYGAADKLKDAAANQAVDFKTFFDRRDDKIWNAALSRDTAFRGAQDKAAKNGLYNKDAIARAAGHKGVADNKFYDGQETGTRGVGGAHVGRGGGYAPAGRGGGYAPVGYNAPGINDYAPRGAGKFDNQGKVGLQGAPIGKHVGVGGPTGTVKGRLEASGGDVLNAHTEKAVQGDLGNQLWENSAESKADARNNYHRDKGVEDSIQTDQANQGKWANQREGFRDGSRQGYNGDRARASRGGEAVDNSFSDSLSSSNLDAADRGLDKAKLDRINLKRNQVNSNNNIRSKKQFYHDKNQDGYNNEGLNYHRNRGNNDFGAQEAAEKEAKTKFANAWQDSKNSRGQRHFEDQDSRATSNGDAAWKRQQSDNGNANAFNLAADRSAVQGRGFDRNRARKEFDRFQQLNNQKNQKNWDRANRDVFGRAQGNNIGRRVDGNFLYQSADPKPSVGYSSSSGFPLGKSRFGSAPLGKVDDYNPYAPASQADQQPVAISNKNNFNNIGAGIGNSQFGQYW